MNPARRSFSFAFCLLVAALFLPGTARASTIVAYSVLVNTSTIKGSDGYLDFQFSSGIGTYDAATVAITDFTSDGTLTTLLPDLGSVTGQLPGTTVLSSSNPGSEYTQGIHFGKYFSFLLTVNVPVVSGSSTSEQSFYLSTLDPGFNNLLTGLSSPALAEIDLAVATDQPSLKLYTTLSVADIIQTPEPGTLGQLASGFLFTTLVIVWYRSKNRRAFAPRESRRLPTRKEPTKIADWSRGEPSESSLGGW